MDETTTAGNRPGSRRRGRSAGHAPRDVLLPRGGGTLTVRLVDVRDADAVTALHALCSDAVLRARYRTPGAATGARLRGEADVLLSHLLAPHMGHTLGAFRSDGTVVGLGHLLWDGADEAETALLVADSWQRRGVGAGLLRRLVSTAGQRGLGRVYTVATRPATGAAAVLRTLGLPLEFRHEEDAVVVTASRVPAPRGPARPAGPPGPGRHCRLR
ncbi:GNAT family N-acetyltransferase [Streptomyces sp. DSM 42041]|uniref:GNAT family N-acetyltransferase n=1 Tax=Streptomyces hazeniae TaxID=3075538 RepID=A0ABU2NWV8_9ACTN|nr:GNAT family N-acetyltransferase [Streptomyces sp. DSM 42041]MDT0381476.1 GNAT family N-acetyltransferase [Streptomyces sp. DSM 42041]